MTCGLKMRIDMLKEYIGDKEAANCLLWGGGGGGFFGNRIFLPQP
jgi:hypothetical protein